jgi:hypothetical protein
MIDEFEVEPAAVQRRGVPIHSAARLAAALIASATRTWPTCAPSSRPWQAPPNDGRFFAGVCHVGLDLEVVGCEGSQFWLRARDARGVLWHRGSPAPRMS